MFRSPLISLNIIIWSLCVSSCLADDVLFHLAKTWAFPKDAPSTLLLKDTPGDVAGASFGTLTAQTAPVKVHASNPNDFDESLERRRKRRIPQVPQLAPGMANDEQSPFSWLNSHGSEQQQSIEVQGPDVTNRGTLLNLARAAWDAYHPNPNDDKDWYDIDGVNWTSRFGWRDYQDGLRGHLFLSPDEEQGIIVFKGTTLSQLGSSPVPGSGARDRLNDNLLFSCCCANVPWRIETRHPCDCNVGKGRCCDSCLTDALFKEETYFANAELVVRYFLRKYRRTNFWLVGHSLGGSVASLVGLDYGVPTVTYEAPGERLAALRLGLLPPPPPVNPNSTVPRFSYLNNIDHITHVFNNIDPLAHGTCTGALSLCAQAGYAMESKCHSGRVVEFNLTKWGWSPTLIAHRMETVLKLLADLDLELPELTRQDDCEDCTAWQFGEFEASKSWWKHLLERIIGA